MVSDTGRVAQLQASVVVRQPLSMVPSAPRFVRLGDRFHAGALLTNTGTQPLASVNVTAEADSAIELLGGDQQLVDSLAAGQSVEASFTWTATRLGAARPILRAEAASGQEDALMLALPVITVQEPVTLATSFVVQGGSEGWEEAVVLPDAVQGTGTVNVTVGARSTPRGGAVSHVDDCVLMIDSLSVLCNGSMWCVHPH